MNETTQEKVEEIFKSDMKTAELMDDLVDSETPEDISNASIEVAEQILPKVDEPRREKYVYATLFQVGKSIQNEQLSEFAAKKLEAWVEKHGQGGV